MTKINLPANGVPTYQGRALTTHKIADFAHATDSELEDDYERNLACCIRAKRDGFVLCLRPTADRPVCIGLGPHAAADALRADDPARFVIGDRYDDAGEEIVPEAAQHNPDCECNTCYPS